MKCKCGGKARVISTKNFHDWTRRQLRCLLCGTNFFTSERFLRFVDSLYTEAEAASIKKRTVEIRRQNEDKQNVT